MPVNARGQIIFDSNLDNDLDDAMGHQGSSNSLVRWEKASEHAYKQAMYLTIGLGTLLLAVS